MKKCFLSYGYLICSILLLFSSCEKDDNKSSLPYGKGVFILNQGSWGENNAGISFYNGDVYFDLMNGTLGDNAQSMFVFNSKLFVAVSGSARIVVLDLDTKATLANIRLQGVGSIVRQPRYFSSDGNKIYVSTFDGYVVRINPNNYTVEGAVEVGPNPEGIAVVNGKIYVANSDGENYMNGYDNGKTVSVIDVNNFSTELKKIQVGVNPTFLHADQYGDIYLVCNGNYSSPAVFQRIDTSTETVTSINEINVSNFTISGDYCYFYNVEYDASYNPLPAVIGTYNINTENLITNNFIGDNTSIGIPYSIGVHPGTGNVYISSTDYVHLGNVFVFNSSGNLQNTFTAGINPCNFAFYY